MAEETTTDSEPNKNPSVPALHPFDAAEAIARALEPIVRGRLAAAADPAHGLDHCLRVSRNAMALSKEEGEGDAAVLTAAAWLHDLVCIPKDSPDRSKASRMAAEEARILLRGMSFSKGFVEAAAHAIEAHSFSGGVEPKTPEARILRDADRLDSLGGVGLARLFSVGGAMGMAPLPEADLEGGRRGLDDLKTSSDHIFAKLLRLEEGMLTSSGRRLARERTERISTFLGWVSDEMGEGRGR